MKKIFLTNGFKYEGDVIKEDNNTIILFDIKRQAEVKIYKNQIVSEENEKE